MSSSGEASRLFNGVSLVARELLKHSEVWEIARIRNFESLISTPIKKVIVSVTDISGLTRGKVRQISSAYHRKGDSVAYFSHPIQANDINNPAISDLGVGQTQTCISDISALSENKGEENNLLMGTESGDLPNNACSATFNGTHVGEAQSGQVEVAPPFKRRKPRERRVPSTPFSRALGFAGLGASLAWGTLQESAKRLVFGPENLQNQPPALSPFLSEKNAKRLALALCRMRGAALKIGQMLSIQDESLVPAPILAALDIVRQGADVMPRSQLNQVLNVELGQDWFSKLISFDYEPMAAASIGQAAQLNFRGQRIWLTAMEELMSKGMQNASQALLSGCSAGGLASILHCDEFHELFPKTTKVKCLSDAGFFLDSIDVSGGRTLRNMFGGVVMLQELQKNLPRTCIDHLDPTMCFFPQNVITDVKTPLFLLNAAYDSWQVQDSLAPPSADPRGSWKECKLNHAHCNSSQIQFLQDFRNEMLNAVKDFSMSNQNGLFINSCFAHCQSERQDTWFADDSPVIGNKAIAVSVGDWYFDRASAKAIDCAYPCDGTCHNLVFN